MYRSLAIALFFLETPVNGQLSTGIEIPDPTSPCTVCQAAGVDPVENPSSAFFTGTTEKSCTDIIEEIAANDYLSGDQVCRDNQLLAFQIGCCSAPPYDHCFPCPDGSDFVRSNIIPIGSRTLKDPTCAESLIRSASYNAIFEAGTCADTQIQRGAFYCGCPNTQQECWLCPDQQPPTNPERGDAFVLNSNCEGMEYYFSLFKSDECPTIQESFGVDFSHFCKCPNYEKESEASCVLCSGGIANPDFVWTAEGATFTRTCSQAQIFADSIIRENICLAQMQKALDGGCQCNSGGIAFTDDGGGESGASSSLVSIVPHVMILGFLVKELLLE